MFWHSMLSSDGLVMTGKSFVNGLEGGISHTSGMHNGYNARSYVDGAIGTTSRAKSMIGSIDTWDENQSFIGGES